MGVKQKGRDLICYSMMIALTKLLREKGILSAADMNALATDTEKLLVQARGRGHEAEEVAEAKRLSAQMAEIWKLFD